jgi:cullin-associated NEDD8-dissociated protein 1
VNHEELENIILDSFSSPVEEIKSAASYSLGYMSIGNLDKYIPFILKEIDNNSKRQYLLLHSLKEIITYQCNSVIKTQNTNLLEPYTYTIWNVLMKHCECQEEGTRNVVAECLGKLTLLNPTLLMPKLQEYLSSSSPYARSTVVTAVKFTITDQVRQFIRSLRATAKLETPYFHPHFT